MVGSLHEFLGQYPAPLGRGYSRLHGAFRSPLAGPKVMELIQKQNSDWRLTPDMELCRLVSNEEWMLGLRTAHNAIKELLTFASEPSVC